MARLVQEDNKHGETRLKLSYSKPVYMARLVQEDNKHGETHLTINYHTASQYTWPDSYRKTINMARRI